MKSTTNLEKEKIWRAHMAKAAAFDGSNRSYCKSASISLNTFQYWRSKFAFSKEVGQAKSAARSAFARAEIVNAMPEPFRLSRLPDPKWMAELILHLSGSCR